MLGSRESHHRSPLHDGGWSGSERRLQGQHLTGMVEVIGVEVQTQGGACECGACAHECRRECALPPAFATQGPGAGASRRQRGFSSGPSKGSATAAAPVQARRLAHQRKRTPSVRCSAAYRAYAGATKPSGSIGQLEQPPAGFNRAARSAPSSPTNYLQFVMTGPSGFEGAAPCRPPQVLVLESMLSDRVAQVTTLHQPIDHLR